MCYLPPNDTSRNIIDVNDFYDTLLFQIYLYQNDVLFYVCGDLNSKIGDSVDFIEGVDDVPEKVTLDWNKKNMYGDSMIDFLLSANCCVLNGRTGICTKDDYDYTSVSIKDLAVVDYCLAPYDMLSHFSNFNVITARQLFCDSGGVAFIDQSNILPDHSLLTWKLTLVLAGDSISTGENKKTTQFTQCSRDVPVTFIQGEIVISEIDTQMQCLENAEISQSN